MMMKQGKSVFYALLSVLLTAWIAGCTQIDITMPKGPKGDQGLSAYEVWKQEVVNGTITWPKDETAVADFFKYLKGQDGKDGKSAYEQWKELIAKGDVDNPHKPGEKWRPEDNSVQNFWRFLTGATGESGQTPHIGTNKNWWIGTHDTGIPAEGKNGKDGADGKTPVVTIGANGNWFIDGVDTNQPSKGADGKDGKTPVVTIGANGNWFIDGVDTNQPSRGANGQDGQDGQDGADGKTPVITIGANGNWFIDGVDTKKPAFGKDGKDGKDGKSAYDLWVEEVTSKCGTPDAVKDPHDPTKVWSCSDVSKNDFWKYLRGKDGTDGADGKDGENAPISVELGKFNVIPQYWNADHKEYVSPKDGGVTYKVFDKNGNQAPAGSKVKGLPGLDPNQEYITEADGTFRVLREHLPDQKPIETRKGSVASVTVNGTTEASAANTLVPNRVNVRVTVDTAELGADNAGWDPVLTIKLLVERQVNGEWVKYPDGVYVTEITTKRVLDPTQPLEGSNLSDTPLDREWLMKKTEVIGGIVARIRRPLVITPSEEEYAKKPENKDNIRNKFRWNNQDNYFVVEFGDGAQTANDYGHKFIVPEIFLSPEVNHQVGLKTAFIEVKTGLTTLFGEVDVNAMSYFYKGYAKDAATNVWKPEQKLQYTDLPQTYKFKITMTANIGGTTGLVNAFSNAPVPPNCRFSLIGAYPNNSLMTSGEDESLYRKLYWYKLQYDNTQQKYYFSDYWTGRKVMDVEQKSLPADWMN